MKLIILICSIIFSQIIVARPRRFIWIPIVCENIFWKKIHPSCGMNAVRQASIESVSPVLNYFPISILVPLFLPADLCFGGSGNGAVFLMPAKWFNVGLSKNLFEAEKISYYLLQLNQYLQHRPCIKLSKVILHSAVLHDQYQDLALISSVLTISTLSAWSRWRVSLMLRLAVWQTNKVSRIDQLLAKKLPWFETWLGRTG